MNIHEYQAKALLRDYGAPVSDGRAVLRAEEAKTAAGELDGPLWVVKAQIHAGGRGKGHVQGGRRGREGRRAPRQIGRGGRGRGQEDAGPHAGHAPDRPGRQGRQPHLHRRRIGHRARTLPRLLVDRQSSRISFVCSTEGGMDIEEVAPKTPEKILSFSVDPATGYQAFHGRRIAFALGLEGKQVKECVNLMGILYKAFVEKDMEMLEINPLIVTDRALKVLDAKLGFDGNAGLPPPRHRRAARRDGGGPQGTRRLQARPELHRARR
jgi:succinyl-CoA synthetase beta subunit